MDRMTPNTHDSSTMTFPKARLAVSACLLVAWLLYLGYLVYETRDQVVLSKPQFMVAQAYVVVDIQEEANKRPSEDVTIDEVPWQQDRDGALRPGQKLHLVELADCRTENGYRGPGKYLIPLLGTEKPFSIAAVMHRQPNGGAKPIVVIYPWTTEVQAQLSPLLAIKAEK
jgi:hypothetical protein